MEKWKERVIRPFDKGSGVFVLDRDDYIKRTEEHINDESTFEKIVNKEGAIKNAINEVKAWVEQYKGEEGMSEKIKEWVIPTQKNCAGNNYSNLKAHKPEKNYPARLISTGCNSFVRNLSELTAVDLNKVPLKYKIEDTNNLLRQIEELNHSGKLEDKTIHHVTFDIVSMFPSIPKDLGLSECKKRLGKKRKSDFLH